MYRFADTNGDVYYLMHSAGGDDYAEFLEIMREVPLFEERPTNLFRITLSTEDISNLIVRFQFFLDNHRLPKERPDGLGQTPFESPFEFKSKKNDDGTVTLFLQPRIGNTDTVIDDAPSADLVENKDEYYLVTMSIDMNVNPPFLQEGVLGIFSTKDIALQEIEDYKKEIKEMGKEPDDFYFYITSHVINDRPTYDGLR